MSELVDHARVCSGCGLQGLSQGYVVGGGQSYYCSDDCLHRYSGYTEYQWNYLYEESKELGNSWSDDNYWTEWDD